MKKVLLAIFILTSTILFSCNTGSGDPKSVLLNFIDALSKKDIPAARKLTTADSKDMMDMMDMAMKMGGDKEKASNEIDKANLEFGEPTIEGDKATVPVKDKKTGETTNYILKKEDGKWKVAFTKSSMMEMGADKLKEGTSEITDSISSGINKLGEEIDSLGGKIKEGIEKLEENKEKIEEAGKKLEEEAKKLEH